MAKKRKVQEMTDFFCCPPIESLPNGSPTPAYSAHYAAMEKQTKWSDAVRELEVCFLEPFDPVVAQRVKEVIEGPWGWNRVSGMQFVFKQDPMADIRISFERGTGSWSFVGTDCLRVAADRPTMNFGWLRADTNLVEFHRVVLHEFGHALGLLHEHQSPYMDIPWDYDKVYAYYLKTNGWNKELVDHNVLRRYDKDAVDATEGDPKSIMCYLIDPLFLTDPMLNIGGNTELSLLDKQKMREMYGDPPVLPTFFPVLANGAVIKGSVK